MPTQLNRFVEAREGELRPAIWSFACFFCVLTSYFLLRPVREEMGIAGGVRNLPWLFTGTFTAMLLAVPVYSFVVARCPRRLIVPAVHGFFAANLLAFFALIQLEVATAHVARVFFIWLSVYNLFVVSLFWSVMADAFDTDQARRLFGFVAAGGTAGALVGPLLTRLLVTRIGTAPLFVLSTLLLLTAVVCSARIRKHVDRLPATARTEPPVERVGGGAFSGIALILRSPYLLMLAAQTLLSTFAATFLYLEHQRIVASSMSDSAERTALFATIDLAVNATTIAVQAFVTGRLLTSLGLGVALALVPALTGLGFAAFAAAPVLAVVVVFQAARRAAHHGLEKPAREVLFTALGREEKYKSKGFIDTVVYRGGDAVSAWAHTGLASQGLAGPRIALSAIPIAAASFLVAGFLARRQPAVPHNAPIGESA